MIWNDANIAFLKRCIEVRLPPGLVIPRHTDKEHFYEIDLEIEHKARCEFAHLLGELVPERLFPVGTPNPVYPSVTGKLQILKDESLINHKMNLAIRVISDYVFAHFKEFTDANVMDHIQTMSSAAERAPGERLEAAGEIGTDVHEYRENFYRDWIKNGTRPPDILAYIPADKYDIRAVSALRALNRFLDERFYVPIACELLVYDHKLKAAGTLDDLGMIRKVMRPAGSDCLHEAVNLEGVSSSALMTDSTGITRCLQCDLKFKLQFALKDLKTSNAFKDHYFFQVGLYYGMLRNLIRLKPDRCFILKVSKEDGRYKIEDLYKPATLASYARSMVRTHKGISNIKELRSDNQKNVVKL